MSDGPSFAGGQLTRLGGGAPLPPFSTGPSMLVWSNGSVGQTIVTRYLTPGYEAGLAPITAVQIRVAAACTLGRLYVYHNTTAGNGNAIVYTVRVNGVASALTVSLASTSGSGQDIVNTVACVTGDRIDIEVTKAIDIAASPSDIAVTLEIGP